MRVRIWFAMVGVVGCTAAVSLAHETGAAHQHEQPPAGMPAPDPAMMEKIMQSMTPGKPHEQMKYYLGTWKATTKMWMSPESEPMVSEATTTTTWLMEGRYIQTTYDGSMMGQPFTGHSIDGYDNVSGKHFNLWFDTMGTGYMLSEGTASTDGKTVTMTGTHMDVATGQPATHTLIVSGTDANRYQMTMLSGPKGQEVKVLEVVYTRL